jgi:ElaB/YqjD/DUF883 family membrane-anchored ribosome-binding protein
MSDEVVQAPTAESSAADTSAAVANAASAITAGVAATAQVVALAERDPCNYEARLFDRVRRAQLNLDAMIQGVQVWAAKNISAVNRSISTWGKDPLGNDLGRSVAFSDYLAANGYIEPFWALFVSSRLPNGAGDQEPSVKNSGSYFPGGPVGGYLGRPGAWVSSSGQIRGPGINEAWNQWTQIQRERVFAASTFRPNWRERLFAWTGSRNWQPGNEFKSGYTVAQAVQRVSELEQQFEDIAQRCEDLFDTQRSLAQEESSRASAWVQGQIDSAQTQAELQGDLAELGALEELDRQKTYRTLGIAAVLGVSAFVAFR